MQEELPQINKDTSLKEPNTSYFRQKPYLTFEPIEEQSPQ